MQVLFVEDDAINRQVVAGMLSLVGVQVTEAYDAQNGLSLIDNSDFNVVLMDLRMPGMDGLEAIKALRARGDVKATTPVIVITADTAVDLHQKCLAVGANDLLHKPIAMGALLTSLGRMMMRAGEDFILA